MVQLSYEDRAPFEVVWSRQTDLESLVNVVKEQHLRMSSSDYASAAVLRAL